MTDIRRLADGKTPGILRGKPFIVMRQSVRMRRTEEQKHSWEVFVSPEPEDSTTVDRKTAVRIIEAHHMSLAHSEACGQIYELPGKPFLKAYDRRPVSKAC